MPATHYISVPDARAFLDKKLVTEANLDVTLLGRFCIEAEARFDGDAGRFVETPIVEATSPQMFAIAVSVCSRRAAASYDRTKREAQAIGPGEMLWAERLEKEAGDFFKLLERRRAPADAAPATNEVVWTPSDGMKGKRPRPAYSLEDASPFSPRHP